MRRILGFAALVAGLGIVGCTDKPGPVAENTTETKTSGTKVAGPKHAGWWCPEHGIPEDECLMCKHSEEDLKKMGDWCEKHEYAKSQCFGCDPKLRERYAARYRDKYGKEPPEPKENPGKD
jgi:hypothetical protein